MNIEPAQADHRIDSSPDFRDGYTVGFLDAIAVMGKIRAETLDAASVEGDGGLAESFLQRQRQQRLEAAVGGEQ